MSSLKPVCISPLFHLKFYLKVSRVILGFPVQVEDQEAAAFNISGNLLGAGIINGIMFIEREP